MNGDTSQGTGELLDEFCVILVEPQIQGNIGAIARSMMNFGVTELRIVRSKGIVETITEEARRRAVHAQQILTNAKFYDSFPDSVEDLNLRIATTGVAPDNEKRHLRSHLTLMELAQRTKGYEGKIGLVFGRENFGLLNPELEICDVVVTIPTSPMYSVMNLSHAVSTVLYELFTRGTEGGEAHDRKHSADGGITDEKKDESRGGPGDGDWGEIESIRGVSFGNMDRLLERIDELLVRTKYPEHKRVNTSIMIRRILGRAFLGAWEYHTLMGVIARIEYTLDHDNTPDKNNTLDQNNSLDKRI